MSEINAIFWSIYIYIHIENQKAQPATRESCLALQVALIHFLLEIFDLSCDSCRVGCDIT